MVVNRALAFMRVVNGFSGSDKLTASFGELPRAKCLDTYFVSDCIVEVPKLLSKKYEYCPAYGLLTLPKIKGHGCDEFHSFSVLRYLLMKLKSKQNG